MVDKELCKGRSTKYHLDKEEEEVKWRKGIIYWTIFIKSNYGGVTRITWAGEAVDIGRI